MVSDAVWLGGIVALSAAGTAWFQSRQLTAAKKQDYDRQDELTARTKADVDAATKKADEVAAQAAEAARLLLEHDAEAAVAAKAASDLMEAKLHELSKGVGAVHELVNSNLEHALRSELAALTGWHAIVEKSSDDPTLESELSRRIAELTASLLERDRATAIADKKLEAA